MNTTEFKVGQKWRVVDAKEFNHGMPSGYSRVDNEDVLIILSGPDNHQREATIAQTGKTTFVSDIDIIGNNSIELIQDTQEDSEELPTEFAVGQLWYVDDASEEGFACPYGSSEGDIIEITRKDSEMYDIWYGYNHKEDEDNIIIYSHDMNGNLKYIGTVETHGHIIGKSDESPMGVEITLDGRVNSTEDSTDDTYYIEIYEDGTWRHAGHTEASDDVSELPCSEAPEDVESFSQESTDSFNSKDILWHIISRAEKYNGHSQLNVSQMDLGTIMSLTRMLDDYVDEFCELRLSWGGDHMGYYTADIYEIASACEGAEDKILMQVEKVTGI